MKRRWHANTWILAALAAILLIIGADTALRLLADVPPEAAIAPVGTKPDFNVGDLAPEFELPDRSGKSYHLSDLIHGDTLLCFTCGCANCLDLQTYMGILLPKMGSKAPAVVTVTTMPKEREETWYRDTRLKQTLLYEKKDGPVMTQYRGHPCPRVYRLRADGRVAWIGPSPNDVRSMMEVGHAVAGNLGFPPEAPDAAPGPLVP